MSRVSGEPNEAARLQAVLDVLRSSGARVSALRVGDVQVSLAAPWPPPAPSAPPESRAGAQVVEVGHDKDPAREAKLQKLREASRKTFGRVLPDEHLLAMEGGGL